MTDGDRIYNRINVWIVIICLLALTTFIQSLLFDHSNKIFDKFPDVNCANIAEDYKQNHTMWAAASVAQYRVN